MSNEDGIYRRLANTPVGPTYIVGYYAGRYDVSVHAGRTAAAPQWWTVRLLPLRGPLADAGSSPLPPNVVSGDAWVRIECGVQGTAGTLLATWPTTHIASVNVYSSSVSVIGMLDAAEVQARLSSEGPRLTAQILDGASAAPTGLRWNVNGGPTPGNDTWDVPIPPGARAYRIAPRSVGGLNPSTIELSQLDWGTPSVGNIVRQVDPSLVYHLVPVAAAHRICDSATHISVGTASIDPALAPGEFDICFDILSGMSFDAL